ncbi:uncharacterized protein LOC122981945 [Thunnus albacares]|uniref:uncharacterized protein LOC122981945 n=1 Tax=Thunnus albacares TaxID=8236 RepID=UPI001CF6AFE3|nr:uncharacterized protein LOC122981945 [Thunnus albacares]
MIWIGCIFELHTDVPGAVSPPSTTIFHFVQRGTQRHRGTRPEPKPRIQRLSECNVEGVEVDQCARGDSVEGQNASRTVHIHYYSVRGRGGEEEGVGRGRDGCAYPIVTDMVTKSRAVQSPGLIIKSKQTVRTVSFPADPSVRHCYKNSSCPLYLPVTATSKAISIQQLRTYVKSVWMIRIWLMLSYTCHRPVVVKQFEGCVYCVCIRCEFTDI